MQRKNEKKKHTQTCNSLLLINSLPQQFFHFVHYVLRLNIHIIATFIYNLKGFLNAYLLAGLPVVAHHKSQVTGHSVGQLYIVSD